MTPEEKLEKVSALIFLFEDSMAHQHVYKGCELASDSVKELAMQAFIERRDGDAKALRELSEAIMAKANLFLDASKVKAPNRDELWKELGKLINK